MLSVHDTVSSLTGQKLGKWLYRAMNKKPEVNPAFRMFLVEIQMRYFAPLSVMIFSATLLGTLS